MRNKIYTGYIEYIEISVTDTGNIHILYRIYSGIVKYTGYSKTLENTASSEIPGTDLNLQDIVISERSYSEGTGI